MKFGDGSRDANSAWFLPTVGLGMRYNLTKNVSLTADWDRLPVTYTKLTSQRVNQSMYSLGVAYKF
jgi:opacity protein-like surface antigen